MILDLAIFVSIYWLCNGDLALADKTRIVTIKNGTLEGFLMNSRRGREIVAFRNIPYAQPPIGELRFEAPKPFGSWTGIRSAKEEANVCPQRDGFYNSTKIIGSEDCLYLNVYSPKLPSADENATARDNYPVMIWLHSGGWSTGAGLTKFYGPQFLLDHDVVLVSVNYRLGPLGFLSTEDLVTPGNQAMKDQSQSIRWVHENIASFGGDPNRITIFGNSAGAASVHYHLISPLTRGLFHRGISQSGTANCRWALSRPGIARNHTNRLAKLLNCPTGDSRELINCLRTKNPADFVVTDHAFQVFGVCPVIPFRPVIEPDHPGAFLKEDPLVSLKSGNIFDVPWITGTNSHEGSVKAIDIYEEAEKGYDRLLDEKFMELAPMSLLYEDTCSETLRDNVTKSIRKFYFGDKRIDESTKTNIIDLYTDSWFYIAADEAVRDHLEALSSPTYYYYFAYKGSFTSLKIIANTDKDYGVGHGDDTLYIFPIVESSIPESSLSEEDHKMVDVMISLWVNFAKSGNPTPKKTADIPIKWKPARTSKLEYLAINGPRNLTMGSDLHPRRVNFWKSIPYRSKIKQGI